MLEPRIFSLSLSRAIIPMSKRAVINSLNDYRPIALTPVIVKCFEMPVQQHIKANLPLTFGPHQFADG
ncbi:hypothetical protein SRHO_G00258200 [Serrasalmus rhombeus]